MKNHCFLPLAACLALLAASCSPISIPDSEDDGTEKTQVNDSAKVVRHSGEVLIAISDTAYYYLAGIEISDITLQDFPHPEDLCDNSRYRMPKKSEIYAVIGHTMIPEGYWQSGQRILCYDDPNDVWYSTGSHPLGTGYYYTFTTGGTITKAGYKTKYCYIPIRTERKNRTSINVNDQWND